MILKNNKLLYCALFLCLPSLVSATITTLQHWDPIPYFNAANLNMPPDTQFCYRIKQKLLEEQAGKRRRFGINITPFVQKATKAQQADEIFYGDTAVEIPTPAFQMSDFQGTPYLMGLFLGQDQNGMSIWGGPTANDNGDVTNITPENVSATLLPPNLQAAINAINNYVAVGGTTDGEGITTGGTAYGHALIADNQITQTTTEADRTPTSPSILSQSVLNQDKIYFGAFSVPLIYQKAGFRWEANLDMSDSVGFLARGGFCQITQRVFAPIPLSQVTNDSASVYKQLNNVYNATEGGTSPDPEAQMLFDQWVTNNINPLLDPEDGAAYDITTFNEPGIEDIQLLMFIRHPFVMHPANPDKYTSLIVTPFASVGWTIPIAKTMDYTKLYALPFGNNGHTAISGAIGLTFDFLDSIEFGFEFGATGFLEKEIDSMPCPNHILQRVLYPYNRDMKVTPGFNSQFAFIFNAFEFAQNTSFSFRYDYVQHNEDSIVQVTPNPYFFPEQLEELSAWKSQMFIAALTFELQPSIYLSLAWQGALAQRNAYCSHTILGSLNFQF